VPGLRRRNAPDKYEYLRDRHVLVVPTTVDPFDVDALVRTWFPAADLGSTGRAELLGAGVLSGPVSLSMEDAVAADVATPWTVVYDLQVRPDRERRPPSRRPDGLHRAFPAGLPRGAELLGLEFLLGAARRLSGGVRPAGAAEMLLPDPASAIDFRVVSPRWVRPADVATIASQEGGEDVAILSEGHLIGSAAVSHPDGAPFEVRLGLGPAGGVSVVARVARTPEPAVAGESFATAPTAIYDIRWQAPDPSWRFAESLEGVALACRERAREPIESITRTLAELGGGTVLDADGFLIDRYLL